jgi:hypothetical protein
MLDVFAARISGVDCAELGAPANFDRLDLTLSTTRSIRTLTNGRYPSLTTIGAFHSAEWTRLVTSAPPELTRGPANAETGILQYVWREDVVLDGPRLGGSMARQRVPSGGTLP